METQQTWKLKFSFRNATIALCLFNVVTALFLLQGFLSSSSSTKYSNRPSSARLRYISESEDLRRAMQPLELIKRVSEIEHEVNAEPETAHLKDTRHTAALDLSKRLNNVRVFSDPASQRALEEWRKRKLERARRRELGRNGTMAYPV